VVHLPLRRLVLRELPIPFRPSLWCVPARTGAVRFRSAVRRSATLPVAVLDGRGGAAVGKDHFGDRVGCAIARGNVQRRGPARQTAGTRPPYAPMPKRNGLPSEVLGADGGVGFDQ
jgi:hypothetical protein